MIDNALTRSPLGQDVDYPVSYDPALLFAIPRAASRENLSMPPDWTGADIWNAYELSWLGPRGKPVVAVARFVFAQSSPNIVESKSFKLYLNSFNETRFETTDQVRRRMQADLSAVAQAGVDVDITTLDAHPGEDCRPLEGISIDHQDIAIDTYERAPHLLRCAPTALHVKETLVSDLLKSNCPVTGQPDWASLQIRYAGPRIDRAALLQYIVSLRRHSEFHEHCVEQIYCDIWHACRPESLCVYARYTRRGGLDINPWRSSGPAEISLARTVRQ